MKFLYRYRSGRLSCAARPGWTGALLLALVVAGCAHSTPGGNTGNDGGVPCGDGGTCPTGFYCGTGQVCLPQ